MREKKIEYGIKVGPRVDMTKLHPEMVERMWKLDEALKDRKQWVLCYSGYRDPREQDVMFLQGRGEPMEIMRLRIELKLPDLTMAEMRRVVTYAKGSESPHCFGMAIDCVPMASRGKYLGKLLWNPDQQKQDRNHWARFGKAVEDVGMKWGGKFRGGTVEVPWDAPHAELANWKDLKNG